VKRPEAGAFREGKFGGCYLEGFVCGNLPEETGLMR
jgi:hypothetical protein